MLRAKGRTSYPRGHVRERRGPELADAAGRGRAALRPSDGKQGPRPVGTTKAEGHAKLSVRRLVRTWDDDSLGCKLGLPENKAGQPLEGETQTPPGVKDEAQLSHCPGKVALKDAKKGKKKDNIRVYNW